MRMILVLALLGACAPRFDRRAHTGPDGQASGARQIRLAQGVGHAHGVVTARGGDSVDWFAFDVPLASPCNGTIHITTTLSWKAPRPELRLALSLYDAAGHRLGRAPYAGYEAIQIVLQDLRPGRYLAKVFAPRRDDAGNYGLSVITSTECPSTVAAALP